MERKGRKHATGSHEVELAQQVYVENYTPLTSQAKQGSDIFLRCYIEFHIQTHILSLNLAFRIILVCCQYGKSKISG